MHAYLIKKDCTTMTCRTAAEAARVLRKGRGSTGPVEVMFNQNGRITVRSLTPTELYRIAKELRELRPL